MGPRRLREEFAYSGGRVTRAWDDFSGRWEAIGAALASEFRTGSGGSPFRLVDLGSNNGFFSLRAALQHPAAEVIGIEGSFGVGNGKAGKHGGVAEILATPGVRKHLAWARDLGLHNCKVAPELWDYSRANELASRRGPICNVLLMLSVVHHVDRLSHKQYAAESLDRVDGFVDLLATLLPLAHISFIELPGFRDLRRVYKMYGGAREILEAAADASGREWRFRGPLHEAKWFGRRELWEVRAVRPAELADEAVWGPAFPRVYGIAAGQEELAHPDAGMASVLKKVSGARL